jgi:hypothetical protein
MLAGGSICLLLAETMQFTIWLLYGTPSVSKYKMF